MRRYGFALIVLLCVPLLRADPPAAVFKDGHWQAVTPPPPPPPPSDPVLDHMQQLLAQGDDRAALNVGVDWVKSHTKTAPLRDQALFLIAECKYKIDGEDDWIYSFYYLDELMDEYPESKLFPKALELQYHIADRILGGHKNKFLGLPIMPLDDQAVEMLYRVQERSPGSAIAQKALLRTCDYYYATGIYDLAHDAYGFYIKTYPRSSDIPQVKLRQAFASLAQFHGVRYDPTCMIDARAELLDIIAAYPELAKQENLTAIIARIDSALARKLLVTADYYLRTSAPRGAVYVYRYLIDTYPDSTDAAEAKKALDGMPKSALADAPPRPGDTFVVPEAAKGGT